MAGCTCGGYREPKVEGHWVGCGSWGVPSFNARLTDRQREQRAAALREIDIERLGVIQREAATIRARLAQ